MYIEKIGYEDEVYLVKKFAKHIKPDCKVDDFFVVKNYPNFINVCFSVNKSPCSCCFTDYEVSISFGSKEQKEECTNIYRHYMYNLFHDRYLDGIKNYYTQNENQQKLAQAQK